MTNFPDGFFDAKRVDGMAIRASLTKAGGLEILRWAGDSGWVPAKGVDLAEFMAAIPASAAFLDRLGVPSDDPARGPNAAASRRRPGR